MARIFATGSGKFKPMHLLSSFLGLHPRGLGTTIPFAYQFLKPRMGHAMQVTLWSLARIAVLVLVAAWSLLKYRRTRHDELLGIEVIALGVASVVVAGVLRSFF